MSGRNLAIGSGVLTTDLDANGKSIVNLDNIQTLDGKRLSSNDYTNEEKAKLQGIERGAQVNPDLTPYAKTEDVNLKLTTKVDKVEGKGLSSNDYTTEEKTKLSGIEKGAQVNPDLTPYAKTAEVNSKLTTKVDKVEGKGLSTEDFTTQEKADLADLKAKRFDVKVDGVAVEPIDKVVNVPTNYAVVEVSPDEQGVARVRPNCINTVKVTTTESDTPVFIDDYGMTEGQPNWNDETLTVELGTLRHKYPFFSSDSYYISGDAYTGFRFDGNAYFDSASPQPLTIKSVVITKIYTEDAFDGMCPFDANITIEYDGVEFYLPSINFDYGGYSSYTNPRDWVSYDIQLPRIMESPVTSQTPIGEYKDLEGLPLDSCNIYFSYMLFSRHPITSNVRTILLDKSSASGVADYLVVIDLPRQARDVEIIGTSDTTFLSSNNEALLLDSGKNLLSFTQLDKNTFFVNRLLIAEVGQ